MSILFVLLTFLTDSHRDVLSPAEAGGQALQTAPVKKIAAPADDETGWLRSSRRILLPSRPHLGDGRRPSERAHWHRCLRRQPVRQDRLHRGRRPEPLGAPGTAAVHDHARRPQRRDAFAGRRRADLDQPRSAEESQPHRRRPLQERVAVRHQGAGDGHQRQEPSAGPDGSARGCRTASPASARWCSSSRPRWRRMAACPSKACSSRWTRACSSS